MTADAPLQAGIELRFVPDLLVFWDSVLTSGLPFSGIRLRNAKSAGGPATR